MERDQRMSKNWGEDRELLESKPTGKEERNWRGRFERVLEGWESVRESWEETINVTRRGEIENLEAHRSIKEELSLVSFVRCQWFIAPPFKRCLFTIPRSEGNLSSFSVMIQQAFIWLLNLFFNLLYASWEMGNPCHGYQSWMSADETANFSWFRMIPP